MKELDQNDLWTQLAEAAQSWSRLAQSRTRPHHNPTGPTSFPPLQLATSSDAALFLKTLNLPDNVVEAASRKIHAKIDQLRAIHLKNYENSCRKYIAHAGTVALSQGAHTLFFQTVQDSFQGSFTRQVSRLKEEFMKAYEHHRAAELAQHKKNKVAFNPEYTPLLEKYFEYNAYPTARDREWLARKSMMAPRQIEVWFQNHRARARKEGRTFQKLSMDRVPVELSLEDLEERMSPLIVPKRSETPFMSPGLTTPPPEGPAALPQCVPSLPLRQGNSVLDSVVAPSYAFPTKYKDAQLSGGDAPFPCRRGNFSLPAPLWYRCPASESPPRQTCTIDELCTAFSSMNLRVKPEADKDQQPGPWYAHRCTGPITAPHPSLIRPIPVLQLPSSRKSTSRRSPTPRRQTQKPSAMKKKRQSSSANRQSTSPSPQPYVANKHIPRMASNSSLSSTSSLSDLETPESSPASSRAVSLPAVHGTDAVDPFMASSTYNPAASFSFNHWAIPQSKSIPHSQAVAPRQTYSYPFP